MLGSNFIEPRLCLWFDNPNQLGAFAAIPAVLAVVVAFAANSLCWRSVAAVASVIAVIGVVFSGSRAALFGFLIGTGTSLTLGGYVGRFNQRVLLVSILCLIICFAAGVHGTGTRIVQAVGLRDGSTLARLTIWRHSLAMIAYRPLTGWGAGESGNRYTEYFQPLGDSRIYGGPSSSYLHIGVEFGVGALFVFIALVVISVAMARTGMELCHSGFRRDFLAGCLGGTMAYGIISVSSTIWVIPEISIWPIAILVWCTLCVMADGGGKRILIVLRRSLLFSYIAIGVVCLAAYAARMLGGYMVEHADARGIVIESRSILKSSATTIFLVPDAALMTNRPGRLVRAAVQEARNIRVVVVDPNKVSTVLFPPGSLVVCVGRTYTRLSPHDRSHVVLLEPIASGEVGLRKIEAVFKSRWGLFGDANFWIKEQRRYGFQLINVEATQFSSQELSRVLSVLTSRPRAR